MGRPEQRNKTSNINVLASRRPQPAVPLGTEWAGSGSLEDGGRLHVQPALPPRDAAQIATYDRLAEQLADYQCRLRLLRHELDKERRWMEARAVRLDGIIGDLDLFLEDNRGEVRRKGRTSGRTAWSRPDVTLSAVTTVVRADGSWEVSLDTLKPFRLPPLLGRIFMLLSLDAGHDAADGLVGFKSNGFLMTELHRLSLTPDAAPRRVVGRMKARSLAQAICELRYRLAGEVVHGDALIQTRRGVGRRIALRKTAKPIVTDAT